MKQLAVGDCLWPEITRVLEDERPPKLASNMIFAVFSESIESGTFQGLATAHDIAKHPDWIFADLAGHRPVYSVPPTSSARHALGIMDRESLHVLPVLDRRKNLLGAVTRQSILQALLDREHALLKQSRHLQAEMEKEHAAIKTWSTRLSELYDASRALLAVLAHTSAETDLLQAGIEALARFLQARYGAIGLLDERGELRHFVHTGISPEEAKRIGHLPEGKGLLGVVIKENVVLRLENMATDPRSAGFPSHHPPMKSLLALPISNNGRVYGRIYLSDKYSGEPFDTDDEMLAQSFARSLALVLDNAREMEEIKHARQHLDYMAHFDALTGLPNRTLLADRVQQSVAHALRHGGMVGVMFIDLDNFKKANDTLGHGFGDQLLKAVAERISHCLREGDTVARLGGDEFIVMLPEIENSQKAAHVAHKILDCLSAPFEIGSSELYITASIGISVCPDDAEDIDGLLANADAAMYHAKKLGKNNYQFFTSNMNIKAQHHVLLENHLRKALERDELLLHYQPQISLESGKVIGMEALLRWNNPELGIVPPGDFIPIAEESGLIVPIGDWVMHNACKQGKIWQQSGTPIRISVNLSGRQFQLHNRSQLLNSIVQILDKTGLSPELLELEVTESIMMEYLDATLDILNHLKKIGVRFSVDDFGTGYSSLSYLKQLPIHALKIDKSFINDIIHDPNDAAITSAIVAMAKQLNLEVIAEGVETEQQLEFLTKLQCHTVQGYYFSRPVNPEEASAFLAKNHSMRKSPEMVS